MFLCKTMTTKGKSTFFLSSCYLHKDYPFLSHQIHAHGTWLVLAPGGLAGAIHGGINFANFGDSEAGVELEAYEVRLLASDLGRDTLGS